MKSNINLTYNAIDFTYILEYSKGEKTVENHSNKWVHCDKNDKCIHLFNDDIKYYRHENDWYNTKGLQLSSGYIPSEVRLSKLKVYIPQYSVRSLKHNVKYMITLNTWVNGYKIDLGSYLFGSTDLLASEHGPIKNGMNEYSEYIEIEILDPFYITYSDAWDEFRKNICFEPIDTNTTGSLLNASLYVVEKDDKLDEYIIDLNSLGGMTAFNLSNDTDFLKFTISTHNDDILSHGLMFEICMNSEYDWLLTYLNETYNINTTHRSLFFELNAKSSDSIILGPRIPYYPEEDYGKIRQYIDYSIINNDAFKIYFSDWEGYEDGWNFVASLICIDEYGDEIFNILSNELPITQKIFSKFFNGGTEKGSEKIIDINSMKINNYTLVNKIENKIVQIERPNDTKSKINQPIFFRVKETEVLTLHPAVNENICINLDDYKNKVNSFILQIGSNKYNAIGITKYGVIFKVIGSTLPASTTSGTYYILNENMDLITSGKYNYAK